VGEDGGTVYFAVRGELGAKDNGKSVSVGGAEDSGCCAGVADGRSKACP